MYLYALLYCDHLLSGGGGGEGGGKINETGI